tara:strand:+ start:2444 stop:2785 length:342 start_codon:yes stop_codon:yes gene_type:complete
MGEKVVPIVCENIYESKLIKGHLVLSKTKLLEDNVLPILKIDELSIKHDKIQYYVSGEVKEDSEHLFEALERSKSRQEKITEDDQKIDDFILKQKEVKKAQAKSRKVRIETMK